jgi:error-prone DNA polymerase
MSVSDETDIFNVIVTKEFFECNRTVISNAKFISVEGPVQNEDGTIHVKASRIMPLPTRGLEVTSHDFH